MIQPTLTSMDNIKIGRVGWGWNSKIIRSESDEITKRIVVKTKMEGNKNEDLQSIPSNMWPSSSNKNVCQNFDCPTFIHSSYEMRLFSDLCVKNRWILKIKPLNLIHTVYINTFHCATWANFKKLSPWAAQISLKRSKFLNPST